MIPANMTLEVSELFSRELTRVCINFFPSFTVVFNVIDVGFMLQKQSRPLIKSLN